MTSFSLYWDGAQGLWATDASDHFIKIGMKANDGKWMTITENKSSPIWQLCRHWCSSGPVNCHNDNLWCHQWWYSCQIDLLFLVNAILVLKSIIGLKLTEQGSFVGLLPVIRGTIISACKLWNIAIPSQLCTQSGQNDNFHNVRYHSVFIMIWRFNCDPNNAMFSLLKTSVMKLLLF